MQLLSVHEPFTSYENPSVPLTQCPSSTHTPAYHSTIIAHINPSTHTPDMPANHDPLMLPTHHAYDPTPRKGAVDESGMTLQVGERHTAWQTVQRVLKAMSLVVLGVVLYYALLSLFDHRSIPTMLARADQSVCPFS